MKTLRLIAIAICLMVALPVTAQTAEEIIDNYFENTGGIENWRKIDGMKMTAKVNQMGMEIPITIVQLKGGMQMTVINFQGQEIKQGVFDGETLWNTNFQTMKAEKADAEATANMKLEMNDFPDNFLDYKDKGYTVELMGTEEIGGTDAFKIKLVKEPVTVDGNQEENVMFYFFDTESFVPIAMQSEIKAGQMKGQFQEITFSDYQEAGDIYMPYSMTQGLKGQDGAPITMEKIEINPDVDIALFKFPEETTEDSKDKKDDNKN